MQVGSHIFKSESSASTGQQCAAILAGAVAELENLERLFQRIDAFAYRVQLPYELSVEGSHDGTDTFKKLFRLSDGVIVAETKHLADVFEDPLSRLNTSVFIITQTIPLLT